MPDLSNFVDEAALSALIRTAREEDLGPSQLDATSAMFIAVDEPGRASLVSREQGVVAGLALLPMIAGVYDPAVSVACDVKDGSRVGVGDVLATLSGPLRSILAIERVALNFVGHLSGVATHTAAFADRIAHTKAKVYDTRKTLPGLRGLQKYAVACGGGGTHRMGLYDAVLVKDNHLGHVPLERYTAALQAMAERARREVPGLKFVMVEVDTLQQLERVLPAGVDLVLLDNMALNTLREAVRLRDAMAPAVQLEASGGVTLKTVEAIAETGVDRISVGALTHSSVNFDVGLDLA